MIGIKELNQFGIQHEVYRDGGRTEEKLKEIWIGQVVGLSGSKIRAGMILDVKGNSLAKSWVDVRFKVVWLHPKKFAGTPAEWVPSRNLINLKSAIEANEKDLNETKAIYKIANAANEP